jgi:hypothetical protein
MLFIVKDTAVFTGKTAEIVTERPETVQEELTKLQEHVGIGEDWVKIGYVSGSIIVRKAEAVGALGTCKLMSIFTYTASAL